VTSERRSDTPDSTGSSSSPSIDSPPPISLSIPLSPRHTIVTSSARKLCKFACINPCTPHMNGLCICVVPIAEASVSKSDVVGDTSSHQDHGLVDTTPHHHMISDTTVPTISPDPIVIPSSIVVASSTSTPIRSSIPTPILSATVVTTPTYNSHIREIDPDVVAAAALEAGLDDSTYLITTTTTLPSSTSLSL
jgi:hypothetical protein